MNPINHSASRITILRDELKLSQKEFAEKIGITQGALSQLEAGKSTLSLQTIVNISQVFAIDCNWLILGDEASIKAELKRRPLDLKKGNGSDCLIPLVKEEAHAGYISQSKDDDYIHSLALYRIPGFEKGNYLMFETVGDSMLPTIHPREILITEHVEDISSIENGTLCVVISEDGIVAKRLYRHQADADFFLCKSDNPDYKTYSIELTKISEIWQIKAKINHFENHDIQYQDKRMQTIEKDLNEIKMQLGRITSGNIA